MCGKFTQMLTWGEVHAYSDFLRATEGPIETVTPMRFANVIRLNNEGKREVQRMRWGFASRRSQDPRARPEHIHARAETIDQKPTFRDAFARARGLLVVRTFNEGKEITPTKTEQHTITPRDGKPIGIAVLNERWTDGTDSELFTFVMVTTPPNKLIRTITDRMPAVLEPQDWGTWLGEKPATLDELKALLVPFEGDWDMRKAEKTAPPPKPNSQESLF